MSGDVNDRWEETVTWPVINKVNMQYFATNTTILCNGMVVRQKLPTVLKK